MSAANNPPLKEQDVSGLVFCYLCAKLVYRRDGAYQLHHPELLGVRPCKASGRGPRALLYPFVKLER